MPENRCCGGGCGGFGGDCCWIIILFILIIASGIKIALKCENLFGKYLVFGIIFQLGFQALLNLMVVVGLIPVTGVTLPFLSYGGSSLMITLVGIGIILNVSRHQKWGLFMYKIVNIVKKIKNTKLTNLK